MYFFIFTLFNIIQCVNIKDKYGGRIKGQFVYDTLDCLQEDYARINDYAKKIYTDTKFDVVICIISDIGTYYRTIHQYANNLFDFMKVNQKGFCIVLRIINEVFRELEIISGNKTLNYIYSENYYPIESAMKACFYEDEWADGLYVGLEKLLYKLKHPDFTKVVIIVVPCVVGGLILIFAPLVICFTCCRGEKPAHKLNRLMDADAKKVLFSEVCSLCDGPFNEVHMKRMKKYARFLESLNAPGSAEFVEPDYVRPGPPPHLHNLAELQEQAAARKATATATAETGATSAPGTDISILVKEGEEEVGSGTDISCPVAENDAAPPLPDETTVPTTEYPAVHVCDYPAPPANGGPAADTAVPAPAPAPTLIVVAPAPATALHYVPYIPYATPTSASRGGSGGGDDVPAWARGSFNGDGDYSSMDWNSAAEAELTNVEILSCGHQFHRHCLDEWFKDFDGCPYCKAPIVRASAGTSGEHVHIDPQPVSRAYVQHLTELYLCRDGRSAKYDIEKLYKPPSPSSSSGSSSSYHLSSYHSSNGDKDRNGENGEGGW